MKTTPPKIIYLQWNQSPDDESTWCADKINDDDVEYVIKSHYESTTKKLRDRIFDLEDKVLKLSRALAKEALHENI